VLNQGILLAKPGFPEWSIPWVGGRDEGCGICRISPKGELEDLSEMCKVRNTAPDVGPPEIVLSFTAVDIGARKFIAANNIDFD
jgi:glutamate formiminotransferase